MKAGLNSKASLLKCDHDQKYNSLADQLDNLTGVNKSNFLLTVTDVIKIQICKTFSRKALKRSKQFKTQMLKEIDQNC